MREVTPIVLLHGSGNGAWSWSAVRRGLDGAGRRVLALDMLGYGDSPPPSASWSIAEESAHLMRQIDAFESGPIHLVAHSIGSMFALHLVPALGARLARLTLLDPVAVFVLREHQEHGALAEMEALYHGFMDRERDEDAGRFFIDHWSEPGAWERLAPRARSAIAALIHKVRLETIATRTDRARLADLAAAPPPTRVLVGEHTRHPPRAVARGLARSWGAEVLTVPGAGHMIPFSHPRAVIEELLEQPGRAKRSAG